VTELLPIVFTRGQNESIDPRVAPSEVHAIAQNVRWRKDGRPAKRYGLTAVTTTGISGYNTQPVNAITSWCDRPVIAVGSSVRQLGAAGWNVPQYAGAEEISHFGPGKREIVARDESAVIQNITTGTAGGVVLHVWDGGTRLYYCVKGIGGEMLVNPRLLIGGGSSVQARCISCGNFIYVLSKDNGLTTLNLLVFDPSTLAFTVLASPGTLFAAGNDFDACGRGTDFVIAYQSAIGTLTLKLFTAVAVPVLQQTRTAATSPTTLRIGVATVSGGSIFHATLEPATGNIAFGIWNTGLTAAILAPTLIETDVNNNAQPSFAILPGGTSAYVVWGGFVAATSSSYTRYTPVSSAGSGFIQTFYGISPASKAFVGPAEVALGTGSDSPYLWVASHNADNGSTKWDTQRAYYLVQLRNQVCRQAHVPNVVPGAAAQFHLHDVLPLGLGYGYLTPLLNAVRFGNGQTPLYGFDTVSVRSIFESAKMAARDTATAGRVLQFSGGSLYELNGMAEETGFSNFPVIQSFTLAGGGALTPGSTYIYKAVYEWLDGQGRRHRSAASDPVTVAVAANTQVILTLKPLVADAHALAAAGSSFANRGTTLHVYRTLAGQSTYHRVTPNSGAPFGSIVGVATVNFADVMSDATAAGQEFLYTEGGVLDNTLAPPHTFQTVCNGRLWLGGQFDGTVITASKILVEGEPTQFSDLASFSPVLPRDCTGIASIDGTVVAFARDRIYFITGDGPSDQGVGEFGTPTELPTDVGCIDWRSVVETSVGIFFQGVRGIYLLPRGFNTPVFIGAEVEDTLAAYPHIVSATLVAMPSAAAALGEITVRFVAGDSEHTPSNTVVLVYDLRSGGWSVDDATGDGPLLSGSWSDAFITSRLVGGVLALHSESAGTGYADRSNAFIQTKMGTGDLRPFGVGGYGQFCSVVLVGEFRASCKVNVQVSVDGATPDTHQFTVTSADGPADNSVYLDVTPKIQKGSSIRVTCWDSGNPTSPTEGFITQALFLETDLIGKTKRLATARRA
jgi:hypothetical protein